MPMSASELRYAVEVLRTRARRVEDNLAPLAIVISAYMAEEIATELEDILALQTPGSADDMGGARG